MAEVSPPDVESPASLHSQPADKVTRLCEADVHALPGASLEEKLTAVTTAHGVLVFSKPGCPFCLEVKRTFTLLDVPYTVVEVTDGEFKKSLRTVSNHATFPNVYIAGKQIGGCDTIKTLQANNKLEPLLQDLSVAAPRVLGATNLHTIKLAPQTRGQASQPLLWFPNVVNRWVIQVRPSVTAAAAAVAARGGSASERAGIRPCSYARASKCTAGLRPGAGARALRRDLWNARPAACG
jgi:glutaredoxin